MAKANILSSTIRATISDCVKLALNTVMQHSDPSTRLPNVLNAQEAIVDAVKTALAEEMRHVNAHLSLQNRLPNEVWCNIWELIPDPDRMSVSRVCTKWRALVCSAAALWKSFQFYTNCHAERCLCSACSYRTRHPAMHSGGWHSDPYPAAWTNVGWAPDALSRSRALPLSLTVDIAPFLPNEDVIGFLAASLLPHIERLISLRLRTCQSAQASRFLARFDHLPALRVLELDVVGTSKGSGGFSDRSHFMEREIALPVLEELHLLAPQHTWKPYISSTRWPPFPTVRKLTAHVEEYEGTLKLLRAFPGVVALTLHLWSISDRRWPERERELQALLDATSLTSVELLQLSDQGGPRWLSRLFRSSALQQFSLCFSTMYTHDLPWALLDELGDGIELRCARTPNTFDLRLTDRSGRVRRLWREPEAGYHGPRFVAQCFSGEFWVPWKRVTSLAVDAAEWVPLVSRLQQWPHVETVRISFSSRLAEAVAVPTDLVGKVFMPALRSVRVYVLADDLGVKAETVASYLRLLRLDAPVADLTLDEKIDGFDEMLFSGVAERVTLD